MPTLRGLAVFFLCSFLTTHEQQSTILRLSPRNSEARSASSGWLTGTQAPLWGTPHRSALFKPENDLALQKMTPQSWSCCQTWSFGISAENVAVQLSPYPPMLLLPLLLETIFCLFPLHVLSCTTGARAPVYSQIGLDSHYSSSHLPVSQLFSLYSKCALGAGP